MQGMQIFRTLEFTNEKAPHVREVMRSEKEQIALYTLNDGISIRLEPEEEESVILLFVIEGSLHCFEAGKEQVVMSQDVLCLNQIKNCCLITSKGRSCFYLYTKNYSQKIEEIQALFEYSKKANPRDRYTLGHSRRVHNYSMCLAKEFKSKCQLAELSVSALLHDIGKLELPIDILLKPGKLTDGEYDIIKTHSMVTYEKLLPVYGEDIAYIASSHHEKLDGSGYPRGLKGNEIPFEAKIIAVADVFDALTSKRSYREPMKYEEAIQFLECNSKQFEGEIVCVLRQKVEDGSIFKKWTSLS